MVPLLRTVNGSMNGKVGNTSDPILYFREFQSLN